MRLGSCGDMQVCGYAARRYTVIGHVALWLAMAGTSQWAVVFTFYAVWHRVSVSWLMSLVAELIIRYRVVFGPMVSFIYHWVHIWYES